MVQRLTAYFTFYAITMKWTMCVQKNSEVSNTSQRPRLSLSIISGDISLVTMIMQPLEQCKTILRFCKKLASCCPGVAFAMPWLRAWNGAVPYTFFPRGLSARNYQAHTCKGHGKPMPLNKKN